MCRSQNAESTTSQRAILGVSQVGADEPHVDSCLRAVVTFIEDLQLAEVGEERIEFLHY
jgi:uncharacterized protein YlxP (DUF503 family)